MTATPSLEWTVEDERALQDYARDDPDDTSTPVDLLKHRWARAFLRQRDEVARLRAENERLREENNPPITEGQKQRFAEMMGDFQQACEEAVGYSPTGETSGNPKDCATLRDQLRSRLLALVEIGDTSLAKFVQLQSDRHWLRAEIASLRSQLAATREGETPMIEVFFECEKCGLVLDGRVGDSCNRCPDGKLQRTVRYPAAR